ncbi:hypothetical protein ACX8XN_13590 [Calditrichota bacterium GD2]
MRKILILTLCLFFSRLEAQTLTKPTIDDNSKFTNVGNIGLTVSNYGTIGDGFIKQVPVDQPSCEYPKGSGVEHLFGGGLWVGAQTSSGIKVTTGAFNSARFQAGGSTNFEFTNTADPLDVILERSSLLDNQFYSPEAVSHQDFVADFTDTNTYVPGTTNQIFGHNPMGIAVHMETYAWNYPFADDFVILNYTITNVWDDTLKDVYVGIWADLVVRNVNITPPRIGAPFYQHAAVGYKDNDEMKMVYCYDYDGDPGYTDSYVSITFLGADPQPGDQKYRGKVTHNWWLFSGGIEEYEQPPREEVLRYERMRTNFPDDIYWTNLYQRPGNWMSLISTGPFERIDPGQSINVVFAIVCAKKAGFNPATVDDDDAKANLYENIAWAQKAYYGEDSNRNGKLDFVGTDSTEDVNNNGKLDRYILPTPPTPPIVKIIPGNGKVTIMWDKSAENSVDLISKNKDFEGYRIYRSFLNDDRSSEGIFSSMQLIREFDVIDGLFYDTGFDEIRLDQPQTGTYIDPVTKEVKETEFYYQIEIDGLHNGWQYAFSVTAFDSGDASISLPSLESSRLQNVVVVTPGTPAMPKDKELEIGVYPNPYRVNALWDGTQERQRKLYFYNLPANCEVRIYTLAGDLVGSFIHNAETYRGQDVQWYERFANFGSNVQTVFPGGEHAWDLVTEADQALATGLYLFSVKDLDNGKIYTGKFVVIK